MMKLHWLVALLIVGLLASPALTYSPWQPESITGEELDELVAELRAMVDMATINRAGSPDFLADLDALTLRFESLNLTDLAPPTAQTPSRRWPAPVAVSTASNVRGYGEDIGKIVYVIVEGSTSGAVWGDGVYTADSHISAAAVHAGVLRNGETGIVAVRILPGQARYEAAVRNGVTTRSYSSYSLSYEFVDYDKDTLLIADPGSLSTFGSFEGGSLAFQVTGSTDGTVWGSDIYTGDSNLSSAAIHAGLLRSGETAVVMVDFLPGQSNYVGSERFGISSRNWGSYRISYRLRNPQ